MAGDRVELVAYHEAGHAVMAIACGFRLQRVSLRGEGTRDGHVAWYVPSIRTRELQLRAVLVGAGGPAADHIHRSNTPQFREEDSGAIHGDSQKAEEFLPGLTDVQFWCFIAASMRFLERSGAWTSVERIAAMALSGIDIDEASIKRDVEAQVPRIEPGQIRDLENLLNQHPSLF